MKKREYGQRSILSSSGRGTRDLALSRPANLSLAHCSRPCQSHSQPIPRYLAALLPSAFSPSLSPLERHSFHREVSIFLDILVSVQDIPHMFRETLMLRNEEVFDDVGDERSDKGDEDSQSEDDDERDELVAEENGSGIGVGGAITVTPM